MTTRPLAIITGASRGIGRTLAQGLAEDGFDLALVARSEATLAQLSAEIAAQVPGQAIQCFAIDVRDHSAIEGVVAAIDQRFGRVDLLVNNAGVGQVGSLAMPIEEFDALMAVNLRGAFSFLQAVVPVMRRQRAGTIINMASRAGKLGAAGYAAYSASKFALVGLSEALYRELTPLGIKVTALCPSRVETDMARDMGLATDEMVATADILSTVRWLLTLSPAACVREIIVECKGYVA